MSDNKEISTTGTTEIVNETAAHRKAPQDFLTAYGKKIIIAAVAVIVVCLGYFGYKNFVVAPKEEKANDAIWKAQQFYAMDSISLALNGDGANAGFEKIAKNYAGTKAGELAKFYAGSCALKLGQFDKAVSFLKDFNTEAKEIKVASLTNLADAYSELGKNADAVATYVKASEVFPEYDEVSSENLFRAGLLSEVSGKKEDAIKYYQKIKEKYSKTNRGFEVEKRLATLGIVEN